MIVTLLKGEANNVLSLLKFQVSKQIILTGLAYLERTNLPRF